MAKRKNVGTMPTSKLRTFNSFDEFSMAAQELINHEMVMFAQEDAKYIMQEVLEENVYSYIPNYYPVIRRKKRGGLQDEGYMFAAVGFHNGEWELQMTDYAPWHGHPKGINMSLADAVEAGKWMHGAGQRPFYKAVEQKIKERLEEDLEYYSRFF